MVPTKIMIFLPKSVEKTNKKYLMGELDYVDKENILTFYILDTSDTSNKNTLGLWNLKNNCTEIARHNFLSLYKNPDGVIKIQRVKFKGENIKIKESGENLLILYDETSFSSENVKQYDNSLFAKLQKKLLNRRLKKSTQNNFIKYILAFLNIFNIFSVFWPFLKCSSIAEELKSHFQRLHWIFNSECDRKKIKVGNLIMSLLLDALLGIWFLNCLLEVTSSKDFPALFEFTAENCVDRLRNLLKWLAGSPAGFKLNKQFNNILAQFFIFHTDIWRLFLMFISPSLQIIFWFFTVLGQFGLSYQAAIVSDLLGLVTFHFYCIYAYAARLYNMQLSGLVSLWRLFIGRKWNPLRQKVDSCHYSADQLFVGTLVFTILLFLLPTTLIYYCVFATSRLVIVGVGGILRRIRFFLHAAPVYASLLWLLGAPSVSPEVRIAVDMHLTSPGIQVVRACRVPDSYLNTVFDNVPDCLQAPNTLPSGIVHSVFTGQLLYPV